MRSTLRRLLWAEERPSWQETRALVRREIMPGIPQLLILYAIVSNAAIALGLDPDALIGYGPVAVGILSVVAFVVWVLNAYVESWRQSLRYSVVLAAIAIAGWLIASLVKGPLT